MTEMIDACMMKFPLAENTIQYELAISTIKAERDAHVMNAVGVIVAVTTCTREPTVASSAIRRNNGRAAYEDSHQSPMEPTSGILNNNVLAFGPDAAMVSIFGGIKWTIIKAMSASIEIQVPPRMLADFIEGENRAIIL